MARTRQKQKYDYEVALSFAGEDREYVEKVAKFLAADGISVFYDKFENVGLWGKNLFDHLADLYANRSKYVVIFASKHYLGKAWPSHERKSAQARAFEQTAEYILPARFDETKIPGLHPTVGYIDLTKTTPREFADLIEKKLGCTSFWRGQALEAASYVHNHLFPAHRGAILWAPTVVAAFANDGRMLDHRYFEKFKRRIGKKNILAEAYDEEEEYSYVILIRSSDAQKTFDNLWRCFAAEEGADASYVSVQSSTAYVRVNSYFAEPVHKKLSRA